MPTIRQLLDRYGQPPAEVALDWAWQIRQRSASDASHHTNNRASRHSSGGADCLLEINEWTQLEVSDEGRLLCQQLEPSIAGAALEDLRIWAGMEPEQVPSALADHLTGLDQPARPHQSPQTYRPSPKPTTEPLGFKRKGKKKAWPMKAKSKRLTSGWLVGGCIALLCIGLLLWSLPSDSRQGTQVENLRISSNAPSAESAVAVDTGQLDSSTLPEIDTEPLKNVVADLPNTDFPNTHLPDTDLSDPVANKTLSQLNLAPSLQTRADSDGSQAASTGSIDSVTSEFNLAADTLVKADASSDAAAEVERTLKKAEAADAVTTVGASNSGDGANEDMSGRPWVLLRDTLRYRVTVPPKLNLTRQLQWTLSIEPIAGLVVEPNEFVTLASPGLVSWRIYEPDAKPPRACLLIRAQTRGRDGTVELLFCGGSEDMPYLSVPLAERWLDPLSTNLQTQAAQLRAALMQLSTTVITQQQAPVVLQRKQLMMTQMAASVRLVAILPDIARLAQLADGQVTIHAELRAKPGDPPLATWGRP